MDNVSIGTILQFISVFGFGGMIFIIWYYDREDKGCLKKFVETQQFQITNYEKLANDLQTVVMMNTEAITKLNERLKQALIIQSNRSSRARTRGSDPTSEGEIS